MFSNLFMGWEREAGHRGGGEGVDYIGDGDRLNHTHQPFQQHSGCGCVVGARVCGPWSRSRLTRRDVPIKPGAELPVKGRECLLSRKSATWTQHRPA